MRRTALFIAAIFTTVAMMATTFTGTVVDENKKPFAFANVVLLTPKDSTFIAGTTTDEDGTFSLDCSCEQALVKISYIGYETIFINSNGGEMGTIQLQPEATMLGEVVVKGTRPTFKVTTEGIKTDVDGTLLSRVGTANDVLQNAFLKAWGSLDFFHGDSKLLTWLSRIAINEALDFMRRQKSRPTVSADNEELGLANRLVADKYFDGDETEAQLQEAISRLPDVQRTVFQLRYYDEMKYSEISRITGTSEGALKASYHIAVKKITDFFKNSD